MVRVSRRKANSKSKNCNSVRRNNNRNNNRNRNTVKKSKRRNNNVKKSKTKRSKGSRQRRKSQRGGGSYYSCCIAQLAPTDQGDCNTYRKDPDACNNTDGMCAWAYDGCKDEE